MTSIKKMIFGICFGAILILGSCGKDDPATCDYTAELEDELNAIISTSEAYGQNPTIANCEAYKASVQAYLNEAEDFRDCAFNAGHGNEYQQAIDQQQAAIDALVCQ
jgi:hypothetical protein